MHPDISEAEAIVPRGKLVRLEGLRTATGPMSVWVEPMDPLDSARLFKSWGGSQPPVGLPDEQPPVDVERQIETVSRPLIERCVKVRQGGALVQAFSWSGESLLPVSNLTANDIAALTEAVTMLMDGTEGDASLGFPVGEHGGGVGAELGAMEAEFLMRQDTPAGA